MRISECGMRTGKWGPAANLGDLLRRRIEVINDVTGDTVRYYYDGVNEIVDADESNNRSRYSVHGPGSIGVSPVGYVDERLMMVRETDSRPYYYVIDRMYNVRAIVDRAGAVVERIAYDPYGRRVRSGTRRATSTRMGRQWVHATLFMHNGDEPRVAASGKAECPPSLAKNLF